MKHPTLSVVVPALNEREALPALLLEIETACEALGLSWEVIVVDDGSEDGTSDLVERLSAGKREIRGIRLRRNFGKSVALAAGFESAKGKRIVTIDGDGQDDPADIPTLLAALDGGADLVSGWKRSRRDPFTRRLASRVFNWVTARLTGVAMHDMNCGFKAYRGECARSLEVYGEMHRFLPAFAAQQGWRVSEVPVNHRPRRFGRSRFGVERYLRGALDLLTVVFIGRYEYRPLHLFGGIGVVMTLIGTALGIYLAILKLSGTAIAGRPLLFLAVVLIVVGVQLLTFGLVAQMLVLARRDGAVSPLKPAQIERTIGLDLAHETAASKVPPSTLLGTRLGDP
jgi:glycosyltransferase involved in cell wall biosynthesis